VIDPDIYRVDFKFIKWFMFHQMKKEKCTHEKMWSSLSTKIKKINQCYMSSCAMVLHKTSLFNEYNIKKNC
jgi:hypothetical protein